MTSSASAEPLPAAPGSPELTAAPSPSLIGEKPRVGIPDAPRKIEIWMPENV